MVTELSRSIDNDVFMAFITYNFLSEVRNKFKENKTIGYIKRALQPSIFFTTNVLELLQIKYA